MSDEALKLAECIGVAAAARELSLYESQLYAWRSKQLQQLTWSERENELVAENARLKRQLAEQAEELSILTPDGGTIIDSARCYHPIVGYSALT
ncbi:Mobile element protein [Dickeya solani RNS 08.23.3.1.A]|nr:Mobile element protein [Dickeya solani RNS 08.23.3.1.A]NUA45757.1 hypothetical protein [Dickeya solani]